MAKLTVNFVCIIMLSIIDSCKQNNLGNKQDALTIRRTYCYLMNNFFTKFILGIGDMERLFSALCSLLFPLNIFIKMQTSKYCPEKIIELLVANIRSMCIRGMGKPTTGFAWFAIFFAHCKLRKRLLRVCKEFESFATMLFWKLLINMQICMNSMQTFKIQKNITAYCMQTESKVCKLNFLLS